MKKQKILITILLTLAYNYLFWQQSPGINILLLFLAVTPCLLLLHPTAILRWNVQLSVLCTLIASVMTGLYGSTIASIVSIGSFVIMTGFIHQSSLKTTYNAFLTTLSSFLKAPGSITAAIGATRTSQSKKIFYYITLSFLPLLIVFIFYWLYKFANPVFDTLSSKFWTYLSFCLSNFLSQFSFSHIFFLLLGTILFGGAVFNRDVKSFLYKENEYNEYYERKKNRKKATIKYSFGKLYKSFLNEYRTASILLGMTNLLLLMVNGIDFCWLWIGFDYQKAGNLAQFVHEGTYLLIASILLSIWIILHFFKGNLNLYSHNKTLKILSTAWILQNMFLAISVGLRNYHYIHQHGLAYKRIGVIIFLVLVLAGLISVLIKIHKIKSSFYLFRVNSWAVYLVMIVSSCFDWDMIIVKNNVNHFNEAGIDKKFLLTLSDKTLFHLYQHRDFFHEKGLIIDQYQSYHHYIEGRVNHFVAQYPSKDWQSFSLQEYATYQQLISTLQK